MKITQITEKDIRLICQSWTTDHLKNAISNWNYQIQKFKKEGDTEMEEYFRWKQQIVKKMIRERGE